jgi:hypothetical protein
MPAARRSLSDRPLVDNFCGVPFRPEVVMLRQLALALLAAFASAACNSTPSHTGSGNVGVDAGSSGTGGSPDAGSPAGSADGGTTGTVDAGSSTDGGGGTADAGATADAGSADAGGGDADAGTAHSECDGFAPEPVGAPNGTHTMEAYQVDCLLAVNGSGSLALATSNGLHPQNSVVHFVGPDGTLRGEGGSGANAWLLGRLSNFVGVDFIFQSGKESRAVQSWDSNGNLISKGPSRPGGAYLAEDPLGGMALLRREGTPVVENYDERGNLRWQAEISSRLTAIGGFAVDRLGNTFITADDSSYDKSVVAQWIDHDGVASPAFQLLGPQREWNHLEGQAVVRVGSGLFVKADAWWQLESMSTTLAPPPAWFIDRGGPWLQMVRNGRAYGIISQPAGPDCTSTVEIVTTSGQSCGKAMFNAGPGPEGKCYFVTAAIGYDGTFVQRMPPPAGYCSGGTCSCNWHWWTGFFR